MEQLAPGVRRSIELPGIEGIVAMVGAGLGVSVVPRLRRELIRGYEVRQIGLDNSRLRREIALACRGTEADDRRQLVLRDSFMKAVAQREKIDAFTRP